jgi:hypothetical protein
VSGVRDQQRRTRNQGVRNKEEGSRERAEGRRQNRRSAGLMPEVSEELGIDIHNVRRNEGKIYS